MDDRPHIARHQTVLYNGLLENYQIQFSHLNSILLDQPGYAVTKRGLSECAGQVGRGRPEPADSQWTRRGSQGSAPACP